MPTYNLKINGKSHSVEAEPDTPLLWVLRDHLDMVGTKYGCGIGQCGACTVHLDGTATRSCLLQVAQLEGRSVTTIEGLSEDDNFWFRKPGKKLMYRNAVIARQARS